jgi:XTP/dITP diphosphohydrolase
MKQLIFATSNPNKLTEVRAIAPQGVEILGLKDIGYTDELPETRNTIEGNSLQKAELLSNKYGIACFSEDTGLEINSLNGEPGVYSARYAGAKASMEENIGKVLRNMQGITDRSARFKTVITYYANGKYVQFEGITEGEILNELRGSNGLGYDPIFKPKGSDKTYAEMTLDEKNGFSHRKKSFDRFANHLKEIDVL